MLITYTFDRLFYATMHRKTSQKPEISQFPLKFGMVMKKENQSDYVVFTPDRKRVG